MPVNRGLKTAGFATIAGILASSAMIAGSWTAFAQNDPASTPVVSSPTATGCDTEATAAGAATTYTIVSDQSVARYIAQEELAAKGPATAVGETQAIIGSLFFDEGGNPLACSRFDVDLRTLVSDESRRDNYLYENTLETGEFPLATFVLASVAGLDGPLEDGDSAQLQLTGDLTLHGTTRSVAWTAEVRLEGDTLTGNANMSFLLSDFGMEEPNVPVVASIDDVIQLQIDLTASSSS